MKQIVALTLSNIPARLCLPLNIFPSFLPHTCLIATLTYSVPWWRYNRVPLYYECQGGQEYSTYNKKEEVQLNWSHLVWELPSRILFEGKVKGRWRRRRKQLLVYVEEKRGYCKLKEEALDRTVWRTRFARGSGAVFRADCSVKTLNKVIVLLRQE